MNDSDNESGSSVESKAGETVSDTLVTTTRSGRTIVPPDILIEIMTPFTDADLAGTAAELHYFGALAELDNEEISAFELILVGAGLGGGFVNTTKLKVMNYKEVMKGINKNDWIKEVANEKSRFDRFNALTAVKKKELLKGANITTSTWATKQTANGKLRGRLNAQGYEQIDGNHYFKCDLAAPVTNATSVRILLVLMAMNAAWTAEVIDVDGAFL